MPVVVTAFVSVAVVIVVGVHEGDGENGGDDHGGGVSGVGGVGVVGVDDGGSGQEKNHQNQ